MEIHLDETKNKIEKESIEKILSEEKILLTIHIFIEKKSEEKLKYAEVSLDNSEDSITFTTFQLKNLKKIINYINKFLNTKINIKVKNNG